MSTGTNPFSGPFAGPHNAAPVSGNSPATSYSSSKKAPGITKETLARDVSKIEQILAMGFTDKKQVVKTLQSNHGDVQRTVDQLLVSKNGGQSVTPATTGAEEGVVGGGGVKSESSTTVTPPRPGSTDATSQTAIGGGGAGSFVANLTSFLRRTSSSGASSSSSSQKGTTAFGQGVSTASLGIGGWEDVNGSPLLTNASALLDLLELSSLKSIIEAEKIEAVEDLFFLTHELDTSEAIKVMRDMGMKTGEAIRLIRALRAFRSTSVSFSGGLGRGMGSYVS